ncbi:hypothetical protein PV328_010349 [Microctonus aethiopoides]|uniref:Uncharacterized protein n=1 Tax=Microctonus aethiopoides TaxID=144406 RepID=A0AA39KQ34_9HYME|nr:hypothetical protein PV328_010349 [Microctonus aethiopoides]
MFALVQFDNDGHCVLPSERVTIIQGKNCVLKYKNDSKEKLMKMQKKLLKKENMIDYGDLTFITMSEHHYSVQNKVGFSTPVNSSIASMSDLEISNISFKNQSIIPSTTLETSDPPSGYTDQFNLLESNWPGMSDEHGSYNIQSVATHDPSQSSNQMTSEVQNVKEFMVYKPSHPNRRSIIAKLRKQGNFLHNTKPELNTGILIVARQRQKKSKNTVEDYEFRDVFKPQNFDDAINSLRKVANWDDSIKWFRTPAVAQNLRLFSDPNANKLSKKYLRACPLMRRFANECGALIPKYQVDRLANFMRHHKDIHKNIYRVPVSVAEITDVSRLL